MRLIGYGGMLTESFVAIMALITAAILNQHLYFAINAPTAQTGTTAQTAADYVNGLKLSGPADDRRRRSPAAAATALARTRSCRAPAARRRWRSACPRYCTRSSAERGPQGVLVPLRDHVRGPVHPHHGRRRAPASHGSCFPTGWRIFGGPLEKLRNPSWRVGAWACSLDRGGGVGQHPADGRHRSPRRDQHAVSAVRHRQPAACRDRADRGHRRRRQARAAEMGLDPRCIPLAWDLDRHHDGVVAEDLLRADPKVGYWSQHAQYVNCRERGQDVIRCCEERPARSTPSSATPSSRARCRSSSRCSSSSFSSRESSWPSRRFVAPSAH